MKFLINFVDGAFGNFIMDILELLKDFFSHQFVLNFISYGILALILLFFEAYLFLKLPNQDFKLLPESFASKFKALLF